MRISKSIRLLFLTGLSIAGAAILPPASAQTHNTWTVTVGMTLPQGSTIIAPDPTEPLCFAVFRVGAPITAEEMTAQTEEASVYALLDAESGSLQRLHMVMGRYRCSTDPSSEPGEIPARGHRAAPQLPGGGQ